MTYPQIILNWYAILASVVATFIFGFLWYGPLLGKTWAKEMGMNIDQKPDPQVMKRGMILQLVGLFLMAFVLAHTGQIWRHSVWGLGEDGPNYMYGFYNGFYTWLGFFLPMQLGKVAWENRSWKLFGINASHDLINLMIISMILSYWR